jgi:hypothetical protein
MMAIAKRAAFPTRGEDFLFFFGIVSQYTATSMKNAIHHKGHKGAKKVPLHDGRSGRGFLLL